MAVMRWDPWGNLLNIQRDLSDLFQRAYEPGTASAATGGGQRRRTTAYVPPIDVFGREGNLVVRAELPGVKPEDVEVTFHNGVLALRGERRHESKIDEGAYFRMESAYGVFERQIQLPEGVSGDDISASYSDGILEITIPQRPQVQPKKVQIAVAEQGQSGTTDVAVESGDVSES